MGISIRGDSPLFSELKWQAHGKARIWHEYAAPADAMLDARKAWKAANPGLGSIKSVRYMKAAAEKALKSPSDASCFRAYDLNATLNPDRDLIVDPEAWTRSETEELPDRSGDHSVGLDLGGSASMTCCVAYWPDTGRMESWDAWPEVPDLIRRGRSDGVGNRYGRMQERREIVLLGDRVCDVGRFLYDCLDRLLAVTTIGADRFRKHEALRAYDAARVRHVPGLSGVATGKHGGRRFL